MITKDKQRGMTFLGLLIILGLIGFFAVVILKMTPLYLENSTVNSALDDLVQDAGIGKKGAKAIRKKIDRNFYINDVKNISAKEDIAIEKSKEKKVWNVSANYEARTSLFGNVGIFIEFQKTVEVPR